MTPTTRRLLGVITLLMLAAGGLWLWLEPAAPTGGVLLRVGLILGAVWLVAPLIRRPSLAAMVGLAVAALVLARPRLLWVVPVAAVVWRLSSARARTSRP